MSDNCNRSIPTESKKEKKAYTGIPPIMFTFKFESLIVVVLDFLVSLHPEGNLLAAKLGRLWPPSPFPTTTLYKPPWILLDEWWSTTVFVVARLDEVHHSNTSNPDGKHMNFYLSNFPFWHGLFFAPKNIHLQSIHSKEKNDQKDGFSKVPFDPSSLQRENDGLALLNVEGC